MMRLVLFSLAGALAGYFIEMVHNGAGVWSLTGGRSLTTWIVPVYFVALLAAGILLRHIEKRYTLVVARKGTIVEAAIFAAFIFAPPLFYRWEMLLVIVSLSALAFRLLLFRQSGDLAIAALLVAFDLVLESAMVGTGLYRYNLTLLPLPLWLAPLWGFLGLSLRRFYRVILIGFAENKTAAGPPGYQGVV